MLQRIFGNCPRFVPPPEATVACLEYTACTLAARLGFVQYLETEDDTKLCDPLLLCSALHSWTEATELRVPVSDRRDTALLLLGKIAKHHSRDVEESILRFSRDNQDADPPLDTSVLTACLVTTLSTTDIWSEAYTPAQLQSTINVLEADEDTENQRLGLKMAQVVADHTRAKHMCPNRQQPGHTVKSCPECSSARKAKRRAKRDRIKLKHA